VLRADLALARRYEALKEDLAHRYPDDRDAYTDGKTTFVAEALGGSSGRSYARPGYPMPQR
jgi:GrpB-like predicted nucleotidyltransferase (UPF0157 family)